MEILPEKVYCNNCKKNTNHYILQKHKTSYDPEVEMFGWDENFYITQCCGCDEVNFTREYTDESYVRFNPYEDQNEYYSIFSAYPSMPSNLNNPFFYEPKKYKKLPLNIKKMYIESTEAYNQELYTLSTIGLRMIIESVCKDVGIDKGFIFDMKKDENGNVIDYIPKMNDKDKINSDKLPPKIFRLYEEKIITFNQTKVLLKIKDFGNSAAHELEAPEPDIIKKMIEIIDGILFMQYELKNILDYD